MGAEPCPECGTPDGWHLPPCSSYRPKPPRPPPAAAPPRPLVTTRQRLDAAAREIGEAEDQVQDLLDAGGGATGPDLVVVQVLLAEARGMLEELQRRRTKTGI